MASFRNLRVGECATTSTAPALEELQRAALATATAAAATFRHWQDGQAAPQASDTANGAGSRRTRRRRHQRRRAYQHAAAAGGAPTDPPAPDAGAAAAVGGREAPPRRPLGDGPLECHGQDGHLVPAAPPTAAPHLGGEIALVPSDRAKTPRPDGPPSPSSGPRQAKRSRDRGPSQPSVDLLRRVEAGEHLRGPAAGVRPAQQPALDQPVARKGGDGGRAGGANTLGWQGGGDTYAFCIGAGALL